MQDSKYVQPHSLFTVRTNKGVSDRMLLGHLLPQEVLGETFQKECGPGERVRTIEV